MLEDGLDGLLIRWEEVTAVYMMWVNTSGSGHRSPWYSTMSE